MEKTKTKKALFMSVLSMVLCIAMLIGMTFAWFTDTASTGVNKIQAGNLQVGLQYKDAEGKWQNAEGQTLEFVKAKGAENETVFWEPGCRYKLPELRVVNNGNLAFKYKILISGAKDATPENDKDDLKLLDVIDWTYTVDGTTYDLGTEKHMAVGTNENIYDILTVEGKMQETAGNEYQGMAIEGIAITVYATQDTVESDSYGPEYDENATYPVSSVAGMKTALTNGGIVEVAGDLDTGKETLKVTNNTTINMNGKEITNTADIWKDASGSDGNWSLISARSGAKLTISGNGTFKAKENDAMAVDVQGDATLTIKNGTFIGNVDAVYVETGTAIIEGGFFDIQQKADGSTIKDQYRFLLNCYDANYKNKTANIIVKGGTFVNFDPSDNPEGAGTTFVADGYKVVSEAHGNDTWYTVVAE